MTAPEIAVRLGISTRHARRLRAAKDPRIRKLRPLTPAEEAAAEARMWEQIANDLEKLAGEK